MKKKITFILAFAFIATLSYGQLIDRYGFNIGASYATQFWDYENNLVELDQEYKLGIQVFLQTEKDLGKHFALRTEFGYIQKGFKNELVEIELFGMQFNLMGEDLVLHDLALNIGMKISPFDSANKPYLLLGLRGDYIITTKDVELEIQALSQSFDLFETIANDLNKFNVGGLIGLGISIKELIYLEVEYNPSFTSTLDSPMMNIKDNYFGAKIGININALFK